MSLFISFAFSSLQIAGHNNIRHRLAGCQNHPPQRGFPKSQCVEDPLRAATVLAALRRAIEG